MSENMDYKELYEVANVENLKLVEKNIELTKELEKYKLRYQKYSSYEDEMQDIIEEVDMNKKKNRTVKKIHKKNKV